MLLRECDREWITKKRTGGDMSDFYFDDLHYKR